MQRHDGHHGSKAHLEARPNQRLRPQHQDYSCGHRHHPHRQRFTPQRKRDKYEDRPYATAYGRHLRTGEEGVRYARNRRYCCGSEWDAEPQGKPWPQGKQFHRKEIGSSDYRAHVQAAYGQEMRQARIAHGDLVGLGDGSAVATGERRRDTAGRSTQIVPDMS